MARYKDNPVSQHQEGTETEWKTFHLFQKVGFFGAHLQDGKDKAALINWHRFNTVSPDLLVMRGDDRYFIEVKAKKPTSYGTYGFLANTIDDYLYLTDKSKIEILLVVRDKSISPISVNNDDAFRVSLLGPNLFKDAVEYQGHIYFQPNRFESLVEWLAEDKGDFDDYNQYLADYAAGRCPSCVDEIDRLIAEAQVDEIQVRGGEWVPPTFSPYR